MGIVNVTPDSFSDGGLHADTQAAVAHGVRLVAEGADILDIGGESTRPGADLVPVDAELARVIPVIEGLRALTEVPISIDTRKAEVMRRAAAAGADILNDVSALTHDPDALAVAAETGLPVILMHAQGDPKTMNDDPQYSDVALDVFDFLEARIAACEAAGIPKAKLVADPGIGFGKHLHHNVAVLASLAPLSRARRAGAAGRLAQEADRPHFRRSQPQGPRAGLDRRRACRRRARGADRARARRRRHPAGAQCLAGGHARHRHGARLEHWAAWARQLPLISAFLGVIV